MLANAIKKRLNKEEGQKGFTLIELLAVIVILGIIAVIAIPMIGGIINKSRADSNLATARQFYDAARLYITAEENGIFANQDVTLTELTTKGYIDPQTLLPSNKTQLTNANVHFDANGQLANPTNTTTGAVTLYTGSDSANTFQFPATNILKAEN
ncbi:type II secretion system protein [Paenibacillus tengchongensis]|uniref:type II secretion system protein n=1 Tax=Paenibacillus tengchongensis TaxID=2608684 RepID=UPI00124DFC3A|nr:type II secretion system protein [Paenibacillus tengchongensis]